MRWQPISLDGRRSRRARTQTAPNGFNDRELPQVNWGPLQGRHSVHRNDGQSVRTAWSIDLSSHA